MYMAWLIYEANPWREISITVDKPNAVSYSECVAPVELANCLYPCV